MVCTLACLLQQLLCDSSLATTEILGELQEAADSPRFEQLLMKADVREAVAARLDQVCTCFPRPCPYTPHPSLLQCITLPSCVPIMGQTVQISNAHLENYCQPVTVCPRHLSK
jgi:hypothetical protein